MNNGKTMTYEDHGQTALEFLAVSDKEFQAGDHLQASEKLWGAATHAVMAAAIRGDWGECRTHRAMKNVAVRLAEEANDTMLAAGFGIAEKFHKNFYHDEMEEYEIEADRPIVHLFVRRTLALANGTRDRD